MLCTAPIAVALEGWVEAIKNRDLRWLPLLCTVYGNAFDQGLHKLAPVLAAVHKESKFNDEQNESWRRIRQLAATLIQKGGEPLTEAQAISKVLESPEGQKLYREYNATKPKGKVTY